MRDIGRDPRELYVADRVCSRLGELESFGTVVTVDDDLTRVGWTKEQDAAVKEIAGRGDFQHTVSLCLTGKELKKMSGRGRRSISFMFYTTDEVLNLVKIGTDGQIIGATRSK